MENLEVTKGCVYFFKHVGLSPVKIGYSTRESPIVRFEQFKTYAPYGGELIGFIRSFEAKSLETKLHERFASRRLNGEWFDVSIDECNNTIKFYSGIEDLQEMNNFQVAWARSLSPIKYMDEKSRDYMSLFNNKYSVTDSVGYEKSIIQNKELINFMSCDSYFLKKLMESMGVHYKSHRLNGVIKKGYLLYKK